jgi:hypothetical protein
MKSAIYKYWVFWACLFLNTPVALAQGQNAILQNIQAQTFLARHRATEDQIRIAQQNAKTFFKQLPPAKKQELVKKKVKTVLIRTVRSKETSPEAKEVRMRVDLQSETLIDDSAYEFANPLPAGTIAKVKLESDYVGP